jgi:hypothetical protein
MTVFSEALTPSPPPFSMKHYFENIQGIGFVLPKCAALFLFWSIALSVI